MEYIGGVLLPHQNDVARTLIDHPNDNTIVAVKAMRQVGKSWLAQQLLLYFAINKQRSKNCMISPTLNQSRQQYNEIYDAIAESGVVRKANEQLLNITLINGSSIFFRSGEQGENLRGGHCDGVIIMDECAYLKPNILELILPYRQVSHCPILVISTPRFKTGVFWNFWLQGLNRQNKVINIDWSKYDLSMLVTEEQKKIYKALLTKAQYKSEILGEFLDSDSMLFSNIDNCICNARANYKSIYGGIDWANGLSGDFTSVTLVNEFGDMVDRLRFNNVSTTEQSTRIFKFLQPYLPKIRKIQSETNSMGESLTNALMKDYSILANKIVKSATTNENKTAYVTMLQRRFEQDKVRIFDEETLIEELRIYAGQYNFKTNKIYYSAPEGAHDDQVMSLMFALNQLEQSEQTGVYNIGFNRR